MEKLLILIFVLFLSMSSATNLKLDRSDQKALITIQRSLGLILVNTSHPCTSPGVFCDPIVSGSLTLLRVMRLRFSSLGLDGFLSPAIGKLTELKELSLNDNNLVDRVPSEIVGCRKLEILNLSNNLFVGNVMPQMGLLSKLSKMDLSKNMLSGNLSFLEQLTGLEYLSLANNQFSGRVPDSIWSFPNLQFVDLSGNLLISGDFARRSMLVEGLTSFENGGEGITLAPADSPGPSPDSWNSPLPEVDGNVNNGKKKKDHKLWSILGFITGLIAGGLSGLLVSFLFKMLLNLVKGKKKTGPTIFGSNVIKRRQDLAFLEQEDGMAALQVIGKGGCGEVYKAELPGGSGIMLAIKKIIQPPLDAAELTEEETQLLGKKMRQIKSEIMTVGKIRHRNLLPLLAHLPLPDCHYLVYEFMKNGSLQDMLEDVNQGRKELDWLARFRIAVGVAHGLEYLHFGQSPMIIHRDLKPANILLDDNMEAKIGDFGLAKTMPDANTHMTSSNVAGTLGYIAPEYHQTLKFTDKCDIYSFGVVLGVLVIGKLPSDEFFQDTSEMSLVGWMRNVMTSDNPIQAIDPNLLGNGCEEDMLLVLKIACFCTLEDPKQRPDSKNVRLMLAQIIKH